MGLRPGRCYSSTKDRPYTRHAVRVQKRDYIGAVPGVKTRQFNMGNGLKEFDTVLELLAVTGEHGIQIRDNAIESGRLMVNRRLMKHIGKDDFFMKLRIYPHHILRENKQAQGAGADRVSKGMSHCFGKSIGRAARVKNGQSILSVLVNEEDIEKARAAMQTAISRFPCGLTVRVHHDVASIGTKPKKTKEMKTDAELAAEEEPAADATAETTAKPEAGKKEPAGAAKKDAPAAKKDEKKK